MKQQVNGSFTIVIVLVMYSVCAFNKPGKLQTILNRNQSDNYYIKHQSYTKSASKAEYVTEIG